MLSVVCVVCCPDVSAHRYAKELAHLKGKFEKEERLRKNAIKNLNRAHNVRLSYHAGVVVVVDAHW